MSYVGTPEALPELESVRRLRESIEGGPGSGPQGGHRKLPKFSGNPKEMKQVNPNPDAPKGKGRNTGPFKSGRGGFGDDKPKGKSIKPGTVIPPQFVKGKGEEAQHFKDENGIHHEVEKGEDGKWRATGDSY